jgi:hypothetical protein
MNNAIQSPCKDCPDRKLHCHMICAKYLNFQKANKVANERERLEKQLTYHVTRFNY